MQADLPHTLYKRRKDEKKGKQTEVRADDPAFKKQKEAFEKKKARLKAQAEGNAPFTMEEIFRQ